MNAAPAVLRSPAEAVQQAVAALAAGRMVVIVDDADRENAGDLLVAAEFVTGQQMAFLVPNATGIVYTPMSAERCAPDRSLDPIGDLT